MQKVIPAVKAIIAKDKKFLIIKYIKKNFVIWDLPGGRIKYNENPYDTLTREVKEETHLNIKIIKPIGIWWFFNKFIKKQVVCTTFLCESKKIKIDLTKNPEEDEIHTEFKWVTKNDFIKNHTKDVDKSLIDLIKNLKL